MQNKLFMINVNNGYSDEVLGSELIGSGSRTHESWCFMTTLDSGTSANNCDVEICVPVAGYRDHWVKYGKTVAKNTTNSFRISKNVKLRFKKTSNNTQELRIFLAGA